MATELWWASIGGNTCEPIRVMRVTKEWFSIGCNDSHPLTEEGVQLVARMDAPDTPKRAEKKRLEWEAKVKRDRKRGIIHGYRRFE